MHAYNGNLSHKLWRRAVSYQYDGYSLGRVAGVLEVAYEDTER